MLIRSTKKINKLNFYCMRKLSLFMLMAVGLLISASMSAGPAKVAPTREAKTDMPQVEKQQMAEPQPFPMVSTQDNSMRKAPKKAAAELELSTGGLENDQVTLKVNGTIVCDTNIVDAFKYVNDKCIATDSATIILQKDVDLASDYYYTHSTSNHHAVYLAYNRKACFDLNGHVFSSSISVGHTGDLIYNDGTLTICDNTADASGVGQGKLFFKEAIADEAAIPGYASNVITNRNTLYILSSYSVNESHGSACYNIDIQNHSRAVYTTIINGRFYSKYCNALRQYSASATNENILTVDGGIFEAGSVAIYAQTCSSGSPKMVTNFSGGIAYANVGYEDDPNPAASYYLYPGGCSMENVEINLSGTKFNSECQFWGSKTHKEGGHGTVLNILNGTYESIINIAGYYDVLVNIYDGVFKGLLKNRSSYSTFNISGGTFDGDLYDYGANYNVFNITGGTFNKEVYNCYSYNTIFNVSGGLFKDNLYLYRSYGNSEINISGGTFCYDIMDYQADYYECNYGQTYATKNKIVVTDGLFRNDIYEYKYSKSTSDIKIMGGYYAYKAYTDAPMDYTLYIPEGYTIIGDGITPWVSDSEYNYYYKVGQETKPEGGFITDPEDSTTTIKVIDPITEEVRDPEPTDNIIITNDNPSEEGDNTYGRDTMYLDNLDVNGITFAGRDTVDVIAKPGSIVNIGSSGIKASDTTTVYITVEGGGAMKVGTEAIQEVDTVIVKSDANGNGTLLISPNAQLTDEDRFATVKLYVDGARKVDDTYYIWQHIAVPTDGTGTFTVENDRKATDPGFLTFVQWWDQALTSEDKWHQIGSWEDMNKPWQGFILTTNSTTKGVTYSFTGNIIGNNDGQLHFDAKGYNFFGNSFTAPINVQTMLNGISNGEDIEMTVWIYSAAKLRYLESNNLMRLLNMAEFDQISSMQGFWLRNMTDDYELDGSVNYTNAVWNNPGAMSNPKVKAPARRQAASEMGLSTAQIIVSNDNHEDKLLLVEGSEYTERFDNGSDASKMIDESSFNIYATTTAGDLACVATDELAGTMLSFKAVEAGEYTMTFANTVGREYVIYDMLTGKTIKMTEGGSFTFIAEVGLNEGRFMINQAPGSVTEMEKVQNTSAVKGVYNMLGQYVANTADWSKLAAGVYVVDGVKVIK